jgi:hypothetical protein
MRRTIVLCILLIGLTLAAMVAIGLLWPDASPALDSDW